MTPPEFRICLELLAWSQRGLARLLGLDDRTVRRWASGQNEIPDVMNQTMNVVTRRPLRPAVGDI